MYEILMTASDFVLKDKALGRFPLIVKRLGEGENLQEGDSYHFDPATEYFLQRSFNKHTDADTIRDEASIICKFLNYFPVIENGICKPRDWIACTSDMIMNYQVALQNGTEINSPSRRNRYISTIYDFYYFCEKQNIIRGVIGFNDSTKRNALTYAIPVLKPSKKSIKKKKDFEVDHLERTTSSQRPDIESPDNWDDALNKAQTSSSRLSKRDEMMLRTVRESFLRRDETAFLVVDKFDRITSEKHVLVRLEKSKLDQQKGTRTVKFHKALYNDLVRYVRRGRKLLTKRGVSSNVMFLSQQTGKRLDNRSINKIFARYDVRPHDGRAVGLTERFIELIKTGHSKNTCLQLVSQEAGHSAKGDGETLEKHYLIAETEITKEKSIVTNDELDKAQSKINELEQEIDRLNKAKRIG
jgi:site-specific recombinase XerD